MRRLTFIVLIAVAVLPATVRAQSCNTADRSVLLILDASGSMVARLPGGESRIEIARRAIKGVAAQVPAQAQLSLRLYGAQSAARQKNCQDTNVAVPFGPAGAAGDVIAAAVDGAHAQGYTPIAHSLQEAAKDFPATAKERVIVLVSDGKETCQGDPAVAAKALATSGITVHTIGFIVDTAARGQLQAIARATGGSYFDAPVGPELPDTLKKALNACKQTVAKLPPKPQPGKLRTTSATWLASHAVLNAETGQKVGTLDSASRELTLPAGIYEVKFGAGSWKGIEVRPGETTTIQPGEIKLDPTAGATVVDSETGEKHGSFDRMSSSVTLMPGVYDVRLGKGVWSFVKVDGGKTVTLRPAQVKLAPDLKWQKARVLTADGAEVFRFDAVTRGAVLVPGNYVVEVDGRAITFNAAEGQVLDVKPQ
jgi:von Willebrand factor type A domain-containing protein